jgi:hypothetical protein
MSAQTPFTTKRALLNYNACDEGYKLLCEVYPDRGDADPITLAEILRSNGIEDAVWALRAAMGDQAGCRGCGQWGQGCCRSCPVEDLQGADLGRAR